MIELKLYSLVMIEKFRRSLDEGAEYAALLAELSKAFDCLLHLIIAKLYAYGFDRHSFKLIQSYLSERYQRVKINTLKEEIFVEDIFAIYDPFRKNLFC